MHSSSRLFHIGFLHAFLEEFGTGIATAVKVPIDSKHKILWFKSSSTSATFNKVEQAAHTATNLITCQPFTFNLQERVEFVSLFLILGSSPGAMCSSD